MRSTPVLRRQVQFTCHCGRNLHPATLQHGFNECRYCRWQGKYKAQRLDQTRTGRIVGEALARFYV